MKTLKYFTRIVLFGLLIMVANTAQATFKTAVTNGNWSVPSTWSNSQAPQDNDTLVIPAGKTVTVDIVSPVYVAMRIVVNGTLHFLSGQKIRLDCSGTVSVSAGGLLTGDSNGSKIEICGQFVWTGSDPGTGPFDLSNPNVIPTYTGGPVSTPRQTTRRVMNPNLLISASGISVYPNPAATSSTVFMDISESFSEKEILVVVINALGQETYSKIIITGSTGKGVVAIDPSAKLDPGMYFIIASTVNSIYQQKLVIE